MEKLDLIIDALEYSVPKFDMKNQDANWERHNKALVAALELRELKPVAFIENHKAGKNLSWSQDDLPYAKATPLYAL